MDEAWRRTLAWALGSFHAGLLVLAFAVVLHRAGNLGGGLAAVGTLPGLAAYALLWALGVRAARAVLADAAPHTPVLRILGLGAREGALTGMLFVAALFLGGAALTGQATFGLVPFLVLALLVAGLAGAALGALLAALDRGLAALAARVASGAA